MNKNLKELCRYAYPVVSSLFYDEVYMIPAIATKIWVEGTTKGGTIQFWIYADIGYHQPTPMYCGRFGNIELDNIVGDDYYLAKDRSIFEELLDSEDRKELATMIAYEIARYGEIDCDRLDSHVSRVIAPRLTARYKEYKEKGGKQ